jgi:hypothetical protein
MAAEIVEVDNVAGLEGGDQALLDVGAELPAVDRAIEEVGRLDPVMTQGGGEGERGQRPFGAVPVGPDRAVTNRAAGPCWFSSRSHR